MILHQDSGISAKAGVWRRTENLIISIPSPHHLEGMPHHPGHQNFVTHRHDVCVIGRAILNSSYACGLANASARRLPSHAALTTTMHNTHNTHCRLHRRYERCTGFAGFAKSLRLKTCRSLPLVHEHLGQQFDEQCCVIANPWAHAYRIANNFDRSLACCFNITLGTCHLSMQPTRSS